MFIYQVVGWYRSLPSAVVGKRTTISDGAIFSDQRYARLYAEQRFARATIVTHEVDELPEDCDYLDWKPPPHEVVCDYYKD